MTTIKTRYLALVLLVAHPEFDVRVTEAVGVHGLEATTFDQTDADDPPPQLSFSVHVGQTHTLILQQAHTHTQINSVLKGKEFVQALWQIIKKTWLR